MKGIETMAAQKFRLDIRMVKFQDYIRRRPAKPFGYYGLGVQYLLAGKPSSADRMFMHALRLDPGYVPAKLGKLEVLLSGRKFLSAARYYHKNEESFIRKKIYITRVQRITGKLYQMRGFYRHAKKIGTFFMFRKRSSMLQRMFNTGTDNPVVNILLAMFLLKDGSNDERTKVIYNTCIVMQGIPDKLRWDLVQALMKEKPTILADENIAGLFTTIPDTACGKDYASFLLGSFIRQQDHEKVLNGFLELKKRHTPPNRKTMWQYLYFCLDKGIWNNTLLYCCQKLISSGWVDSMLASTVKELKQRGLAENTHEMDKILSLYGY